MIRILSQSEGNLVVAQASQKLTGEDYAETWAPLLRDAIAKHGTVRALLYLDETFEGWEVQALWEDAKLGLENANDFEKIALVGGSDWLDTIVEWVGHLLKGSVKTFPAGALEEALDWIR
jgi:hypothetical protein